MRSAIISGDGLTATICAMIFLDGANSQRVSSQRNFSAARDSVFVFLFDFVFVVRAFAAFALARSCCVSSRRDLMTRDDAKRFCATHYDFAMNAPRAMMENSGAK